MEQIITISGKAGHGKDSSADVIKAVLEIAGKRVLVIHIADYLKFICKKYLGGNGEKDSNGRSILQSIGTDKIRAVCPNFWVDIVEKLITVFSSDYDFIIIPDTRFPNEIDRLKSGKWSLTALNVIKINNISRLEFGQQKHISETALDDYDFDYEIVADDIWELKEKCIKLTLELLKTKAA